MLAVAALASWQKSRLNHKLQTKLKEIRDTQFEECVSKHCKTDRSIWKSIKNIKEPKLTAPSTLRNGQELWVKGDREKALISE